MNSDNEIRSENVVAGIVGALLFALGGGVAYFLLARIGFVAGITGLIAVILACKGYEIFAKKESTKGIVISCVMAVVVIVLAWYLSAGYDYYEANLSWFESGESDYKATYFECVRALPYLFIDEPDILFEYLKDLLIGLVFAVIGGFSFVMTKIRNAKAAAEAEKKRAEAEYAAEKAGSYAPAEPKKEEFDENEQIAIAEELEEDEEADSKDDDNN